MGCCTQETTGLIINKEKKERKKSEIIEDCPTTHNPF